MRTVAAVLLALLSLAGCKREPTFDERYDAANKNIVERARRIDAQVAGSAAPPAQEEDANTAP